MGMIARRKLKHTAAGLLGNFISRNNRYQEYWAPGVLYTEARASGLRTELDLLRGQALPEAPTGVAVARGYAAFLRSALARHGLAPDMLSSARLSLVFGLPEIKKPAGVLGDPFECTLTLATRQGKAVTRQASAHCAPHDSQVFRRAMAMHAAAWRLHRHVGERDRDGDREGRWALDVLREAYADGQLVAFDLLRACAVPPHPAGDAVARGYAACLRRLMGEWMDDLHVAEIRLRFSTYPGIPDAFVFAENRLVARDGYVAGHNGSGRILPEAPQAAP